MDYLTKNEALEILQLTSYRQLKRVVDKYEIQTKSLGNGKPTLYLDTDIHEAFIKSNPTKKYSPKKSKAKAADTKIKKEKEIEKKETAKKETESKTKQLLSDTGQEELLRVEKELQANGTYKDLDRALLLSYAVAYQNYMYYISLSGELDHITTDLTGNEKISPYFQVADKCFTQMDKMAKTLGIGARNRLGLELKGKAKSSIMDFINE